MRIRFRERAHRKSEHAALAARAPAPAAPHYFKPERLAVGSYLDPKSGRLEVEEGQFVDGGVSTANNPSFQLLKVALLDLFAFEWTASADELLLVSLGTGPPNPKRAFSRGFKATAAPFAFSALVSLMKTVTKRWRRSLQWLSNGPPPVGSMVGFVTYKQRCSGSASSRPIGATT